MIFLSDIFGDILEMFTYRFRIIPSIFVLCLSVFGSHPYWDNVNNVISPALHESSFLSLKQLWDFFTLVPTYLKFCLYLSVFLLPILIKIGRYSVLYIVLGVESKNHKTIRMGLENGSGKAIFDCRPLQWVEFQNCVILILAPRMLN